MNAAAIGVSVGFPSGWFGCDVAAGIDPVAIAESVDAGIAGESDLGLMRTVIIDGLTAHATDVAEQDGCTAAFRLAIDPDLDIVTATGAVSVLSREPTSIHDGLAQTEAMLEAEESRRGWRIEPTVGRIELPMGSGVRRDLVLQTSVPGPSGDTNTGLVTIRTEYWVPITGDQLLLASFGTIMLAAAEQLRAEFQQIVESIEITVE